MIIRKFYDAGQDSAGGVDDMKVGEQIDGASVQSMMDLSTEDTDDEEDSTSDGESDAAKVESTDASTSTQTEGNSDSNTAPDGEAALTETSTESVEDKPLNIQEVLSKFDRTEVLRAAGLDDYDIKLITARAEKGNLNDYFRAAAQDIDAIPALELKREQLKADYPNLSEGAFEKLFQREVVEKYSLDELSADDDKELGQAMLEKDVAAIRAQRKEEQAKLLDAGRAPESEETKTQREEAAKQQKADYDKYVSDVQTSPATKSLVESKKVVTTTGTNVVVANPQAVVEAALDTNKFFQLFAKADGSYDLDGFYAVTAFAQNRQAYEQAIFDAGKAAAAKEQLDEHVNTDTKRVEKSTAPKSETMGQAFANRGRAGSYADLMGDD